MTVNADDSPPEQLYGASFVDGREDYEASERPLDAVT
jgi:hypothetical protein